MSFLDLREFLDHLESRGELARITAEVDPDQEITIIQHRVLARGGPALLFENVKGSPYRLVSNLFGTARRVEAVFGCPPAEIGEELVRLAERLMPPSPGSIWSARSELRRIMRSRLRTVRRGPVLADIQEPPDLERLPCLTCWPLDGGPFFTLPLVQTADPETGRANLGIYRLQRYDSASTGMHWQIEKGGGFHFQQALRAGCPLPVSVLLGGPPALTLAAVAPLPEGVDERLLAALMLGRPLDVIRRPSGHRVPARCEFILEGSVSPSDERREGPFGDHLGHYSHSADFPVYRVDRVLARRDAIYPATVVGRPAQEDLYIGNALQEMALPILRLMRPAVKDIWAYPETGFHPLAVAAVDERYPREALKHALGLLGEGQVSLTKVMMVVGPDVPVRDFSAVARAIWRNLDLAEGLHLLAPTAQDTLDFTGPAMNTGSRLILLATERPSGPLRTDPPPPPPPLSELDGAILELAAMEGAFLLARVADGADRERVRWSLANHPVTRRYLFQVLLSEDVPLEDPMLVLWGWFTRFDPLADLHPARRTPDGNRLLLEPPIAIDATWKEGYRLPVAFDPDRARLVEQRWSEYGISMEGEG